MYKVIKAYIFKKGGRMFLFGKKEEKKVSVSDLKRGLKRGEFVFYYQPEFNLKTGKIIALEALMRWHAPNGIIPPNDFIPVLEQSGLINKFTEYLFRQSLADLKKVHQVGYSNVLMAVNLSAIQLQNKSLILTIKKVLEETKTEAKFLECEITESQRLILPEMQEGIFKELANLGVAVAIDDFGMGYSSFNYLRYLNVSKLERGDIIKDKSLNLMGEITMPVLNILLNFEFDYLDISEAQFGIAYEPHWTCHGWSHSGPVESVSYKKVEMLRVFLENIRAKTILLPDDVMQRHINSAKRNDVIQELKVNDTCPQFAYENGKLMNKKKTRVVFG